MMWRPPEQWELTYHHFSKRWGTSVGAYLEYWLKKKKNNQLHFNNTVETGGDGWHVHRIGGIIIQCWLQTVWSEKMYCLPSGRHNMPTRCHCFSPLVSRHSRSGFGEWTSPRKASTCCLQSSPKKTYTSLLPRASGLGCLHCFRYFTVWNSNKQ